MIPASALERISGELYQAEQTVLTVIENVPDISTALLLATTYRKIKEAQTEISLLRRIQRE